MSVVLAGRRWIYVLLLFRERVSTGGSSARALRPIVQALSTDSSAGAGTAGDERVRVRLSARIHRRWGQHLLGLSLFVLTFDGTQPSVSASRHGAETMRTV
jgi:hypothetical protein